MKKKAKAESARAMKRRHIETLGRAWKVSLGYDAGDPAILVDSDAELSYRQVRAAVRAVLPGRQQAKNLAAAMEAAVKAAARAIRANP